MKNSLILLTLITFLSCNKTGKVETLEKQTSIVGNAFPDSIQLGDIANLKIYHEFINGCAQFSRLEKMTHDDTQHIKSYANYRDGNCTQVIIRDSIYFPFEAVNRGTYYFSFGRINSLPDLRDSIIVY